MKHIISILLLVTAIFVGAAQRPVNSPTAGSVDSRAAVASAGLPGIAALPPTADTTVWLMNIYPGVEPYQLEGHTALLVQIKNRPTRAYNFGVFDFDSPNFTWRFVSGQTDYMAVVWPYDALIEEYARDGRRAVAHRIDFDAAQKARLLHDLDSIVRPENRLYRYNYVKDNCATRPLAAIERATGDSIRLGLPPFAANSAQPLTFRNIMRYYHRNYPWYQFGIDLALGSGIDYPLNSREATFAPVEMDAMLPTAVVGCAKDSTAEGERLLSDCSIAVIDLPADYAVEPPTPWYLTPMAVFCALLLFTILLTIRDLRRRRTTRWFDAVFYGILGLAGCLLTFLIFVSSHEATSPNWLYLWLNPLCLLVPTLIWLKKCKKVLFCYQTLNFAVLLLLCALWPLLPQSANPAFLPIITSEIIRSGAYIYLNRKQ
ncbi:MAG: DUF4105 domain-containing protein [Muribaculaceae bacterium]|nr:DUF4105 domain-containing protein [Muribaculaceae bacterium]